MREVEVVKKLCEDIEKLGGKAYIVGGYVRDKLLGKKNSDIDIEVFGIEPSTLENLLDNIGKWRKVGSFEIYLLLGKYEISLAKEGTTIEKASKRRDLTVNSIYYDLGEDRYIDVNNGIEHIKKGILSYVDKKEFLKDPLRLLRVYTFLTRYPQFSIDNNLKKLLIKNKKKLNEVKKERFQIEFEKMAKKSIDFEKMGEIEGEIGLLSKRFQMIDWTRIGYKKIKYSNGDFVLFLLLLLVGQKEYMEFLNEITYDRKLVVEVEEDLEAFKILGENIDDYTLKKISLKSNIKRVFTLYEIIYEKNLDNLREKFSTFEKDLKPIIKGKDLIKIGFESGKYLGEVIELIFDMQLRGEIKNKNDGIAYGEKMLKYRQKK